MGPFRRKEIISPCSEQYISIAVEILDLETFWSIGGYDTVKKPDRMLMTKDKKKAYGILEKGICFNNGHYEVAMLWKDPKALKSD